MIKKYIFILIVLLILTSAPTVLAYSDSILERPQTGYDINDATEGNPLIMITEKGPYPSGTEDIDFIDIENNYDESILITIELSNDRWEYSDGSDSKTIDIDSYSDEDISIDTTGPTRSCDEIDNRELYEYTYSVSSNSLTIFETTNTVEVCAPGEGSEDDDDEFDGPPGQDPDGPPGQQ